MRAARLGTIGFGIESGFTRFGRETNLERLEPAAKVRTGVDARMALKKSASPQLMRRFSEFAVFITTLQFNRYGFVTLMLKLPVLELSGFIVIV